MVRYFAFLRAINVGGHVVKMDLLRHIFETLGLTNVETYIASGNVIFETKEHDPASLEKLISARLQETLGYEVETFIRTTDQLYRIAEYQPFPPDRIELATALNVALLASPPEELSVAKLNAFPSGIDFFHVDGREVYWMCLKKQSESTFSNAVLEKITGQRSTLRGINTIQKIAEKYLSGPQR